MRVFCKDCRYLVEKKFDADISCASDIYYVCAAPDWYGHEYGDIDHAAYPKDRNPKNDCPWFEKKDEEKSA